MIAITTSNSIKVKAPSHSRDELDSGLVITVVGYFYVLFIRGQFDKQDPAAQHRNENSRTTDTTTQRLKANPSSRALPDQRPSW